MPPSPTPLPGARAGGVQLRPALLSVLRTSVRGAAEKNHRPVVLLRGERERGGEGGEAQLPEPAELLLKRRAVSVREELGCGTVHESIKTEAGGSEEVHKLLQRFQTIII